MSLSPRAGKRFDPEVAGRSLVDWYAQNRRDLAFRRDPNPYRVWVSEIMLQQTTVAVVGPYFTRFMDHFPTLTSLAAAREPAVLSLWSGLGYYHRARNLLKAARVVRDHYGGLVPSDLPSLLALPGVGAYTAGAILAIGHNLPAAALDGNVMRVVSRLAAFTGDPVRVAGRKRIEAIVLSMIPQGEASSFTQALMDLGSGICTPRAPRCLICPVSSGCEALRRGLTGRIPQPRKRKESVDVPQVAVVVRRGSKCLLTRRQEGSLMEGMWEFPLAEPATPYGARKMARRLGARLVGEVGVIRHTITHHRMSITVYDAAPEATPQMPLLALEETKWLGLRDLAEADPPPIPLTGTARKIARLISKAGA